MISHAKIERRTEELMDFLQKSDRWEMVTNSTRLMQRLELWRLWLVKGALKGKTSETLCLRETLAMFSSPIILGKAMNEFNESCVFLGSWYTDNKIGDGLSISDKFQCFIGFTNFVVTVVYIVFLLPSNWIKSQWVPSADHTRYRENPPLTSTIIIEKDYFSIARLLAGNPKSTPNKSKFLKFLQQIRENLIFGWFQHVSTQKNHHFWCHKSPSKSAVHRGTTIPSRCHGSDATRSASRWGPKPEAFATFARRKPGDAMRKSRKKWWWVVEWWVNGGLMLFFFYGCWMDLNQRFSWRSGWENELSLRMILSWIIFSLVWNWDLVDLGEAELETLDRPVHSRVAQF